MRLIRLFALLLSCVIYSSTTVLAADDVLVQAKQQLDGGNAQAAYNLLIPLQSERAGDPNYDFLLGSAALELGKNTEAVFALERVLAVMPNNGPARERIARAYFNLKELETSKREFENVKRQDVPPEVAATIDRFLDAISRDNEATRTTIHGFVELGFGYDSNVNSATADSQIAVPAFGGLPFVLAPASREVGDTFFNFGGGVSITSPLSRRLSVFGGVTYQNKTNTDQTDFSTYYYDLNLGLAYRYDRDTITLAGQLNSFFVDDTLYSDAYRNATGVTLQWQHDFDSRNQITAYGQYTYLAYPGQDIRNANRYLGGAGYAHAFGRGTVVTYLGAYGGSEVEKDSSAPQFGNDFYGARIGLQWNVVEKYSLFVNASAEDRKYGGPDPLFFVDREDKQYNASGGMIFVPKKNLRITPQVMWTNNTSNLSIYAFDRIIYQILLHYDM